MNIFKMSSTVFDWYIPKCPQALGNDEFESGKILTYIRENNSIAVKTLITEDLIDCDAKHRYHGSFLALVMIAVQQNKYECGMYFLIFFSSLWNSQIPTQVLLR